MGSLRPSRRCPASVAFLLPGGSCSRWSPAPFPAHCYNNYLARVHLRWPRDARQRNARQRIGHNKLYTLGSFQQTSNPNQNYGANKCHYDGTYYAAAGPDS